MRPCTEEGAGAEALTARTDGVDQGKIVALGTSAQLKTRLRHEGHADPTMEDGFMDLTGKSLTDDTEKRA